MGAAQMCETLLGVDGAGCFGAFPFEDGFDMVVDRVCGFGYLRGVADVLVPAIDVLTAAVEDGERSEDVVRTLMYAINAHARLVVALAYEEDVKTQVDGDRVDILRLLEDEWQHYVEQNGLLVVARCQGVETILGENIRMVWSDYSLRKMVTTSELLEEFRPCLKTLRVVVVGSLLVESASGKLVSEMAVEHMAKPLISRLDYASVLRLVRDFDCDDRSLRLAQLQKYCDALHLEGSLACRAVQWMWIVISASDVVHGYCYQLLLEPRERFMACVALGENPVVDDFLWLLGSSRDVWCGVEAKVDCGLLSLHVWRSGNPNLALLEANGKLLIGKPLPMDAEPDYYARALIDDFILRHKKPLPAPPPVDGMFEQLTIAPAGCPVRGFSDVSQKFYARVGEPLSPRASSQTGMASGLVTSDEYVTELDSDRIQALNDRLSSGAVVDESYFVRTRKRFMRRTQRPRLDASEGRCYHVFAGFPADGGGTTDRWQKDEYWDIPGWSSYVAKFSKEHRVVQFVASDHVTDVRIDCSGEGIVELGSCRIVVNGSVLWFSKSIKMRVETRSDVVLRVSVPESGSSLAIGADMRRYMHIPGYAVVARSFDISSDHTDLTIDLDRKGVVNSSGCQIRSGNRMVERGRHRFKLNGLSSAAPVKLAIKADPVEAFDGITVCGLRLRPRTRDFVTVLYDASNAGTYVTLIDTARIHVSVLQVVNFKDFDIVAQSVVASRVGALDVGERAHLGC